MAKFPNAIVITGSIGSGKSTFSTLLRERGYAVIDADAIAHHQLEICAGEVASEFGQEILTNFDTINFSDDLHKKMAKIDRKKLGAIVFNDSKKLKRLEQILHPKISAEIYALCKKLERLGRVYFVDIPLYFEGLGRYDFSCVAVVYAPKNLLIKRVMKRNSLEFDEAKRRVELQIDIEKKREMADFVIDNSKNIVNLRLEVEKFLKIIETN